MLYFYGNSYKEARGNKPVKIKTTEQLEGYKQVYDFVIPAYEYFVMFWNDEGDYPIAVFDVIADDEAEAEDIALANGGDAYEDEWPMLVEPKDNWLDEAEQWKEDAASGERGCCELYKEVR